MALQKDKPPRPDLSQEDVRQIVQINALGLEITVRERREIPRRKTTINALGLEPMRRNVQRPSRGAAPVRQRPSTEEIVAEFEDMKVSDVATKERAELQSVAAASSDHVDVWRPQLIRKRERESECVCVCVYVCAYACRCVCVCVRVCA